MRYGVANVSISLKIGCPTHLKYQYLGSRHDERNSIKQKLLRDMRVSPLQPDANLQRHDHTQARHILGYSVSCIQRTFVSLVMLQSRFRSLADLFSRLMQRARMGKLCK